MKQTIIILSGVIVILITVIIILFFFSNWNVKKLQEENKVKIENYKLIISNLDNSNDLLKKEIIRINNLPANVIIKYLTKTEYINLPDEKKGKYIFDLETDHKNMTKKITEFEALVKSQTDLIDGYKKTINKMEADYQELVNKINRPAPSWGISLLESAVIKTSLSFDSTTNLTFKKYFDFTIVYFYVGGGVSFAYEKQLLDSKDIFGGGFNFELGLIF
jgi:hypothetical protein